MFVSGQGIGSLSYYNYPEFYSKYLHASFFNDVGSWLVQGISSGNWPLGIYDGVNLDISLSGDGANNQSWPDVVAPANSQAVSVANYSTGGSGALAVDGPLHRLMYFSFGFEGINGANERSNVMDRTMKFLNSPTENTSLTIKYSSDWNTVSDSKATDGRYQVSSTIKAMAEYQFTGDNINSSSASGGSFHYSCQ
ncbi:MAG: Subtilisin [Desulfofundulus kuznetsovii]|nr:MAG: Subtilisin [Desulfotomaculum sp. 46_80]KUK85073.1 MAG: Subtilisin [Desulfofundulus kuznetsovii]